MSTTPFHDIADELRAVADRVAALGDQVHTGSYTVPPVPPETEQPIEPTDPTDPDGEVDPEPEPEPENPDETTASNYGVGRATA